MYLNRYYPTLLINFILNQKHLRSTINLFTINRLPRRALAQSPCIFVRHYKTHFFPVRVIDPWPNTYSFTKAVAESLIETHGKNLPISIARPSVGMLKIYFWYAACTDNTGCIHLKRVKSSESTELF